MPENVSSEFGILPLNGYETLMYRMTGQHRAENIFSDFSVFS